MRLSLPPPTYTDFIRSVVCAATVASMLLASGCAAFRQAPRDPVRVADWSSRFSRDNEDAYYNAVDENSRRIARDRIVSERIDAYNAEYQDFRERLTLDRNFVSSGGSLVALILGGLGATTGSAATASALAAASGGIVGAQGIVSRDLYFERTLPALVGQMDAARLRVKADLLRGLHLSTSDYSLIDANTDLGRLGNSGSILGAIEVINSDAAVARRSAEMLIVRDATFRAAMPLQGQLIERIDSLSASAVVHAANAMVAHWGDASSDARSIAELYLPPSRVFQSNQSGRARQFLKLWIGRETLTETRAAQWRAALNPGG